MKKLLVFFITFFVILPLPFSVISCSMDLKNNSVTLTNWFNNEYPDSKIDSIVVDENIKDIYKFSGFYIDEVKYQNYSYNKHTNIINNSFLTDYVIYSKINHKFYDSESLSDNFYGLISWVYTDNNDISSSIFNYHNTGSTITNSIAQPILNPQTQYTDFNLHIWYTNNTDHSKTEKVLYAKWAYNMPNPKFVIIKDNKN